MSDESKRWSDAAKAAKIYSDSLAAIEKKTKAIGDGLNTFAQEMGFAYGSFIKQQEKSQEQMLKEKAILNDITLSLKERNSQVAKSLGDLIKINDIRLKSISLEETFNSLGKNKIDGIKEYKDIQTELVKLNKDDIKDFEKIQELKNLEKEILEKNKEINLESGKNILSQIEDNETIQALLKAQGVDLENNSEVQSAINKMQSDGAFLSESILLLSQKYNDEQLRQLGISKDILEQAKSGQSDLITLEKERERAAENVSKKFKEQIGLSKDYFKNFSKEIFTSLLQYDQAISDAGRDFGFMEAKSLKTSWNMTVLGQEAAKFNVSMAESLKMMGGLGDELAIIDQDYLANSVQHFMAIEKAVGLTSGETNKIAGEMMRAGNSAEDVRDFVEDANKNAKMLGVNSKKVLQGISRNIDKMRQMGFVGGEESLSRMVATAERLRMNVDEIFDVAKRARTIEGALEMAADLQLAGGSFANINPMDLLAASRKGPEELQKILTQMGGDIGSWVEDKNGNPEFQFDPIDVDRLQMVADATGQSLDSIQKMIQKNAEDNKKVDLLGLSSSLSDEEKNFLTDFTKMKDGQITVDKDLKELAKRKGISLDGVNDLSKLNQEQIQALMDAKAQDIKTLEEQAQENQSLKESFDALKAAFVNLFVIFEPAIKRLTQIIQFLGQSVWGKLTIALIALVAAIPLLAKGFSSFKESVYSWGDSFKKIKDKGFKSVFQRAEKGDSGVEGADSKDMTPKESGGGLKTLAEGLKAMGDPKVFAGIGAVALAGPALALMLLGMPTLFLMGAVGAMGKLIEFGFRSLANGISAMGEAKGLIKGAIAMVIIGASLIPFAFALQMMADVSWKSVIAGLGFLLISAGIIIALGALMMSGVGAVAILAGAAAMVVIGAAVLVFAHALNVMTPAAESLSKIGFSWLFDMGMALLGAAPGLLAGGAALLIATPGLLIGSLALYNFAGIANSISSVDWDSFSKMGSALMSVIPGLIGFSIAGLMFANPITMLGMILMMGTLASLASVISPLSTSLNEGSDGLDKFAVGLEKLQKAANNLDLQKLEALKDLSFSMAVASIGGGIFGDQIKKIAEALAKLTGTTSKEGGGTKKIEINLKLSGRDLQTLIIDDTSIVS